MANGVRITWTAATDPAVVQYEIRRSATPAGTQATIAVVPAAAGVARPVYDDLGGELTSVYQVLGLTDRGVVVTNSGLFRSDGSKAADLDTRVPVDHNYGGVDALRYVAPSGAGVPQATVHAYKQPDWDRGRRDLAVSVTQTDDDGRWQAPLFLEVGYDYVIVLEKEAAFGPDVARITV